MSTTSLFVELLLIGVHTATWASLLAMAVWGLPAPMVLDHLKHPMVGVPAIGLFYIVAIMLDVMVRKLIYLRMEQRIAERLVRAALGNHAANVRRTQSPIPIGVAAQTAPEGLQRCLAYYHHRMVIMRSSSVNFFLLGLAGGLFVAWRTSAGVVGAALSVLIGSLLAFLSFYNWQQLASEYIGIVLGHSLRESIPVSPTEVSIAGDH